MYFIINMFSLSPNNFVIYVSVLWLCLMFVSCVRALWSCSVVLACVIDISYISDLLHVLQFHADYGVSARLPIVCRYFNNTLSICALRQTFQNHKYIFRQNACQRQELNGVWSRPDYFLRTPFAAERSGA